jgi:Spy/CpxP family protein refolding chaperone
MKKVAILFVFMCAFIANTFAQTDAVPAPIQSAKMEKKERKAKMKQAANDLGLTSEQKVKMKEIGQSLKGKMMAIKSDASLTKDQKKAQIGDVAKQHQADLKAVLSPEQFTKWEEMKKARRASKGGKFGRKGEGKSDGDGN